MPLYAIRSKGVRPAPGGRPAPGKVVYVYLDARPGEGWTFNLGRRTHIDGWAEALKRYEAAKRSTLNREELEILWRRGRKWRVIWPLSPLRLIVLASKRKLPRDFVRPG